MIAAVLGQLLGFTTLWTVAAGVMGFLIVFGFQVISAYREISSGVASYEPKFPAPPANDDGSRALDPPAG